MSGTRQKRKAKPSLFNDFCVSLNAWDKLGTSLGQGWDMGQAAFRDVIWDCGFFAILVFSHISRSSIQWR
jgi:hypothetical protein